MRALTLCLLVFVSACCMVSVNANASSSFVDVDLENLIDDLDEDYVDVEVFGFFRTLRKLLRKILKTVRGVNCIAKAAVEVLDAATAFVDDVDACGTAVPKDVLAIVDSCKTIIDICNDIINFNSKLCVPENSDSDSKSSRQCFKSVLKSTMRLAKKIKTTVKQIDNLPKDTSSCFTKATDTVKANFNKFWPQVEKCADAM